MQTNKLRKILVCVTLVLCLLAGGCSKDKAGVKLDPDNPIAITLWHYYNGAQQDAFNELVKSFNDTQGKEEGIIVQAFSQGNVTDLESNVLNSVNGKVGGNKAPNIFAAYADTAYAVDKLGYATDIAVYLSEEERSKFIESYVQEGDFYGDGSIKIFPIAKSTEIFVLNKTDWDKFASATSTTTDEFSTIEGLADVAEKYYEWTDSLTATANDGKAFFGRDAMANYLLIGAKQLGIEMFSVENGIAALNFDKDVVKKLWDNYYVPYINGYFSSSGRFRSDDVKSGNIISFVGSSSGATFFPNKVILDDTTSYPIETQVFECPRFKDTQPVAVQQGAGMVVTKGTEQENFASVEFLKWFTQAENNIKFSVSSGYLPVLQEANNIDAVKARIGELPIKTADAIATSINTVNNSTLYTTKAFANGTSARNILETALSDAAKTDRTAVEKRIEDGMTRQQAVETLVGDENFNTWYEKTLDKLQGAIKK